MCRSMSILFFATVHPPLLPSHRRHHRSGVFTNSMIGQDHGKCQVGHLALPLTKGKTPGCTVDSLITYTLDNPYSLKTHTFFQFLSWYAGDFANICDTP